jgi:hypothetical protein
METHVKPPAPSSMLLEAGMERDDCVSITTLWRQPKLYALVRSMGLDSVGR